MVVVGRDGQRMAGRLRRGAVTILPEGWRGEIDVTGEGECSQVVIPVALYAACIGHVGEPHDAPLAERLTVLDPVLFQLVDMLTSQAGERNTMLDHIFCEQVSLLICTHLGRRHGACAAPPRDEHAGLTSGQLRRIHEFLLERLDAGVTLRDIAAQVALSPAHVCTAFRTAAGLTPFQYLASLRMDRAKELLGTTDASMTEVAMRVGYATASAFTASFRRVTGMTPTVFRKRV